MSHHYKVDKKAPLKMKNTKKKTEQMNPPKRTMNHKTGSKQKLDQRQRNWSDFGFFNNIVSISAQDLHIGAVNLYREIWRESFWMELHNSENL